MSVFENIKKQLDIISKNIEITENEKEYLLRHKSVKKSDIEIGDKKFQAWRIIHNDALGPGKGGIRFHPNVSEDEVKSLSFWMSLKNSLAGLPYGGAKGGIKVDPKELSTEEIEKLSREYIKHFHEYIGQDKDIPAPDVYTNPQIMAWMLDEFEKIKGHKEPAMITGKPLELGGIKIRADSTSKGGLIIFKEFTKANNLDKNIKIAIQGFGNAGWNMAKFLHEEGYKVVAVSDSKGGIYDDKGLNIPKVKETKNEKGTVTAYEGRKITNEELLELDVDVLVLAALENQITKDNADRIKAKYIIELANGPITPEVDEILHQKGILVIPDILANSGGVVGSYFEWVQGKIGYGFTDEYIEEQFKKKMEETFRKVYKEHKTRNCSMRTAAYIIAINRILKAAKARGEI